MSKRVINIPEGYKIKEFDAQGSTKSISQETYATEIEAERAILAVVEPISTTEPDIDNMKINDLRTYAREKGVDIKGLKKKTDIINKINE